MTPAPRRSRSRARTDRRNPISRVRSVTDTSMTFMMPIPPTTSKTAATAAGSHRSGVVDMSTLAVSSRVQTMKSLSSPRRSCGRRAAAPRCARAAAPVAIPRASGPGLVRRRGPGCPQAAETERRHVSAGEQRSHPVDDTGRLLAGLPFVLLDLWVTAFQWTCFPVYGIARVRRRSYFVVDRHRLNYLNAIEKVHCVYFSYANGSIAYVREVAGRTEAYWCPIKHARAIRAPHGRYQHFFDYGDAGSYRHGLRQARGALTPSPSHAHRSRAKRRQPPDGH